MSRSPLIGVRLPEDVHVLITQRAEESEQSVAAVARDLIIEALGITPEVAVKAHKRPSKEPKQEEAAKKPAPKPVPKKGFRLSGSVLRLLR